MTRNGLSIFNQLRPVTVGFDNMFDHFESMFDGDVFSVPQVNFPPYNIVKTGDFTYDVELALAGYSKEDITVDYADNLLTVKSIKKSDESNAEEGILHRGIAKRYFSKAFTIADDVEVRGAELKDGILKISMERIIPEGKKPRSIDIK